MALFHRLLYIMFFAVLGCGKQSSVSYENDDVNQSSEDNYPYELDWAVELKLKPHRDENYLITEDAEIIDLISKHGVTFYQSYPGFKTPELLLLYTLQGKGNMSRESRENVINDFLATGKFENDVRLFELIYPAELDWAVELKLNLQEDKSYLATEDAEIIDLISKHGVTFYQSCPGARNPELLLYYILSGKGSMSRESRGNSVNDFLATGKFEDDVRVFGIGHHY